MSTSGTHIDEQGRIRDPVLDLFLGKAGGPPPVVEEVDAEEVARLIPQLAAAVEVLAPQATPRPDGRQGNNNFNSRKSTDIAKSLLYRAEIESGMRLRNGRMPFTKLTGPHYACISLHMVGIPQRDIAAALNRKIAWVGGVLNDPLAKAEIKRRSVLLDMEFSALHGAVVDAVRDGLGDPDPGIKLRASEQWLKAHGRFAKSTSSDGLTAEDIVKGVLDQVRNNNLANVALSQSETHVHVHIGGGEASDGGLTQAVEILSSDESPEGTSLPPGKISPDDPLEAADA